MTIWQHHVDVSCVHSECPSELKYNHIGHRNILSVHVLSICVSVNMFVSFDHTLVTGIIECKCVRISYMNLQNSTGILISLTFIMNVFPYLLHVSTKFNWYPNINNIYVYHEHVSVSSTCIYKIQLVSLY